MSREARKGQRKARRAAEREAAQGPSPEVTRLRQEVVDLGRALEDERAAKHAVLAQLAEEVEGRRRQGLLMEGALAEQQRLRNLADLKKARVSHLEAEIDRLEVLAKQALDLRQMLTEANARIVALSNRTASSLDLDTWRLLSRLVHPDKHPPERAELAHQAMQYLNANRPPRPT